MSDAPVAPLAFFRDRFGLDEGSLEAVLGTALERRVDHAELFFEYTTQASVALEDGIVKSGSRHLEQGVGVRALAGERQGYAHSDEVTVESMQLAAGTAPAEVLASFGVAACKAPADTAELCRMVLSRVHVVQDEEMPRALVAAAREGRTEDALQLLKAGAPWDAIDEGGHSAGSYALRDGHGALLEAPNLDESA